MISDKAISYLDRLSMFGCQHALRGDEVYEGRFDLRKRFADVTDEDIKKAFANRKCRNIIDVIDTIESTDPEVRAHLAGFASAHEYQMWLDHILDGVKHG